MSMSFIYKEELIVRVLYIRLKELLVAMDRLALCCTVSRSYFSEHAQYVHGAVLP